MQKRLHCVKERRNKCGIEVCAKTLAAKSILNKFYVIRDVQMIPELRFKLRTY